MNEKSKKIIIEGITDSGETFRPRDWAERLSGSTSTFKNRRITYSPLLQPSSKDGNRCVILDQKLKASNPDLYQSILDFATTNNLKICPQDED